LSSSPLPAWGAVGSESGRCICRLQAIAFEIGTEYPLAVTLAIAKTGVMPSLGQPDNPNLPFFAYGLLKPGEPAYSQVEPFVSSQAPATALGTLRLRDGIPLFDPGGDGRVVGQLLWFDQAVLDHAWAAVSSFEPATQYRWSVVDAHAPQAHIRANVLEGRRLQDGTAGEGVTEWSAAWDPVFTEGLDEVRRLVHEAAPNGVNAQPDTPELWQNFFRLQAAYLLLWSIIERYTALRFGPGRDPWSRVVELGRSSSFCEAVVAAGARPSEVVDSRDPKDRHRLTEDGAGAAEYFYQVRSNLSHRGKSAFRDAQLVLKAVTELERTMQILLAKHVRPVANP